MKKKAASYLALTALLILSTSKTLAQCGVPLPDGNIILTVPAGGDVTSQSDNFNCAAGETCSFVISNLPFSDTFTATAADGFKFTGWKDSGVTSLCPAETGSCVVDLGAGWTGVEATRYLEPIFDEIETLDLLPADTRGVLQVYPRASGAIDLSTPGTPWALGPLQILEQQSAGMDVADNSQRIVLAQMSGEPNQFLLLAELDTTDVDSLSAGAGLVDQRFHLGYPLWKIGTTGLELARIDNQTLAIGSAATLNKALDSYIGLKPDIDMGPLGPYIGTLVLGPSWPNSLAYGLPALYNATPAPGSGDYSLSQARAVNSFFNDNDGTLTGALNFLGDNVVSYEAKLEEELTGYATPTIVAGAGVATVFLSGLSVTDDVLPLLKTLVLDMDGVDYAAGVIQGGNAPFLNFLVGEAPNSIFINYEFKDQQAQDDFAADHLPEGFTLAPLSIIESETPRYYLVLNIYQSGGGLVTGARAEWSVFVNDPYTGEPRFLVVQAAAETIAADSVNLLTLPEPVTHELTGGAIVSYVGEVDPVTELETEYYSSSIDWPQSPEARTQLDREFVVANDYIFWGNGVADRGLYNSTQFNRDVVEVDPGQMTATDSSEWAAYVNTDPVHTLVYLNPLEIVISPWWNLDEPYLDSILEDPSADPTRAELIAFKNGFYPNLVQGNARAAIRGEGLALASTTISDSVPTARYHFPLMDPVGLLTEVAGPGVHTPVAVALFDGETPGHYVTLNVYQRETDTCGIRAEWVTYVEGTDGRADALRIDAIASEPCLDPVSLMTLAADVSQDHNLVSNSVDTVINTPFIQFDATVDLDLATGAQVGLDWLESGDRVCSVNDVCDDFYIEGQHLMEQAQRAEGTAITIIAMETPWDLYIDTLGVRAGIRLVPALQAMNPWRTMRSFAAPAPLP